MSNEADELFIRARDLTEPDERAAYLREACGDDAALLARVQYLLADSEQAESYFAGMDSESVDEAETPAWGSTESNAASPNAGQVIGRYQLLQQIGEGGFGTVWMAEQTEPVTRKVALKIIKEGMDTRSGARSAMGSASSSKMRRTSSWTCFSVQSGWNERSAAALSFRALSCRDWMSRIFFAMLMFL